jgi:ribosomal-protein-alanine N-acetyltransferase
MSESDLDCVLEIESASFTRPWTRAHFLDEIQSPFGFPLIAVTPEHQIAGYLCLKLILDEAEILDVAVADSLRGRGIGRLLVQHACEFCRDREVALLGLEVRASNQAAIGLYRQLGFTESGRRRKYYENGEDALLMDYRFDRQAKECDAV